MNYAKLDENNIYQGMVSGIPGDVPGSFYSPPGVRVALTSPPTDEPGEWRDSEAAWVRVTPEELAAMHRAEVLAKLAKIDAASIRPLRAVADGTATAFDRSFAASFLFYNFLL
jgi:hypothetical protein